MPADKTRQRNGAGPGRWRACHPWSWNDATDWRVHVVGGWAKDAAFQTIFSFLTDTLEPAPDVFQAVRTASQEEVQRPFDLLLVV